MEFLTKLIELLTLPKTTTALRIATGFAFVMLMLYSFYEKIVAKSQGIGLPVETALLFAIPLSLCIGVLAMDLIIWAAKRGYSKFTKHQRAISEEKKAQLETKELQEKCRLVVRHLSDNDSNILHSLKDVPAIIDTASNDPHNLEEHEFIQPVFRVDRRKSLYRLNPLIEPIVKTFFAEQRHNFLVSYFKHKVSQNEVEFLKLFADPRPDEPDLPEHPFLEHRLYIAMERLINRGILIRYKESDEADREMVRMANDALGLVQEYVLKAQVERDQIVIDLNQVAASGAGGSGAPGGMTSRG